MRSVLAAILLTLATAPVACAQPSQPAQSAEGGACTADREGVMTWLPGADMPSVCQGGAWRLQTTPQPPADRWLSTGPPLKLHGQGQRNPNMAAGTWTGTPQDPTAVCRAQRQVVVSPGELSAPQVDEGGPGQPINIDVSPRTSTIELSGNCLWARG